MKYDFDEREEKIPQWLQESISNLIRSEKENDTLQDCYWAETNSDINVAENNGEIPPDLAYFLRGKYLFDYSSEG